MKRTRGFTLIEMMVVVGIVGILVALSLAAYGRIGEQAAPQNAVHDFYSALQKARSSAMGRNARVWMVVYPSVNREAESGNGAWFMLEDLTGEFADPASTFSYANFDPSEPYPPVGNVRLLERNYLDDYPKANARFGVATGHAAVTFKAPFTALNGVGDAALRTCSFCSGNGAQRRGAIVFEGNGSARFLDGDGSPAAAPVVAAGVATPASRTHALALSDATGTDRGYLIAISGPTGFIGFHQ